MKQNIYNENIYYIEINIIITKKIWQCFGTSIGAERRRREARRPKGATTCSCYAAQTFRASFLINMALPTTKSSRPVM